MKKLLSVSIMAMLAVSPMMAHAAAVITPAGGAEAPSYLATTAAPYYTEQTIADTDKTGVASAAYVKGAYNNAIRAINKVAATANAGQTESQVKTLITDAAGNGLTGSNGVLAIGEGDGINVAADAISVDAGHGLQINSTDKSVEVKANADGTIVVDANGVKVGAITANNVAAATLATATGETVSSSTKLTTKAYVDGLASNYDAAGAASTAEQNAKDYADGLATNYDAAGAASTAEQNAKDYADSLASNYDAAGTAATAAAAAQTAAISAVEGKLDDGATGYDVNFKTAKIQGISVATKADVNTAIDGSSVSASGSIALFEEWGDTSATANAVTVNVTGTVSKTAYTEPSA